MKCVILAAGMSTRLRPLTDHLPKCLLPVGGKTILERTVENLSAVSVSNIALVVGFEAEKVRRHLKQTFPDRKFRFILNPNFTSTNNAYSLLLARDFFLTQLRSNKPGESLLLLDSDIIFHSRILDAICSNQGANRIAVRVRGGHDEEEIRVRVNSSLHVTRIDKDVEPTKTYGESIGIEVFSYETGKLLFETLERRIRFGNGRKEFYEAAFQEMINLGVALGTVDVGDYPVIEIDSPSDLEYAEQVVIPLIENTRDVRVR